MVFIAGTLFLVRSKIERHFIFFLIRTKHLLNLIDYIANIAPKFWKFLADLAIIFSFSGLGVAYLSRYRRLNRNLDIIFGIIGVFAIALWWQNIVLAVVLLILLIIVIYFLSSWERVWVDFLFSAGLITMIFIKVSSIVLAALGIERQIPLYISMIEGVFGIPPLLIMLFLGNAYQIVFQSSKTPGVSPMIPAVQEGELGVAFPGYPELFVPLVYALIAIVVVLVSHEFAHGILTRVYRIKLKSTGLLTFGILPIGAFVEPDEKEMEKRPSIEKMHIFSMGSFANVLVCILAVIMILSIPLFLIEQDKGLVIASINETSMASGVLKERMIIYRINGEELNNVYKFVEIINKSTPGDELLISTDQGEFKVKTISKPENPEQAYLGLEVYSNIKCKYGIGLGYVLFIIDVLKWIVFFNFNIALVNLLPLVPFDGWRMLRELMLTFNISEINARKIVQGIVAVTIFLFLVNILPLIGMIVEYIGNLLGCS